MLSFQFSGFEGFPNPKRVCDVLLYRKFVRMFGMRFGVFFSGLLFVMGLALGTFAQTPKPTEKDEVIRVETQLVEVPVAVVSANGTPVRGLKASNFVVTEDGKPQAIEEFSTTMEPFEVALLLDTSGSTRADLRLIQSAAQYFVASLRPGDRVAIIAYSTQRKDDQAFAVDEVVSPLTDDRRELRTAIDNISTSNGTPFYDSLLKVVGNVFRDPPKEQYRGRRALVALTDGVDSTSAAEFDEVKDAFDVAGIISFFIQVDTRSDFEEQLLGDCHSAIHFSAAQIRRYYRGIKAKGNMEKTVNFCQLGDFERLAISKKLYEIADTQMNDLAKTSGGKVFPVGDISDARNAFKSVADEIGTKYALGYYSSNEKRDGTYRKIRVDVKGLPAGSKVRAREGYTAPLH
jgi:Ca-activated chloride channel family protein